MLGAGRSSQPRRLALVVLDLAALGSTEGAGSGALGAVFERADAGIDAGGEPAGMTLNVVAMFAAAIIGADADSSRCHTELVGCSLIVTSRRTAVIAASCLLLIAASW